MASIRTSPTGQGHHPSSAQTNGGSPPTQRALLFQGEVASGELRDGGQVTRINTDIQIEVTGTQLADWWWFCDSGEQAEFFTRLEAIKAENPTAFLMQLEYLREALERLFEQTTPAALATSP